MGQSTEKFPKTSVGAHQEEQIWRDFEMFNIHINAHKQRWLKDVIDIMDCHRLEEDFCGLPDRTLEWELQQSPAGSGAVDPACTDMVNGVLNLVTEGDDGDNAELTQICECWQMVNCYPLYGEIRFYLSDVIDTDFWFGYTQDNSWFTTPNDYAVFKKDDGNALLDFVNDVGGAGPTAHNNIATLVVDTWYRLGIHWDGQGTIRYFLFADGNFPQTVLASGSHTALIPTAVMTFGFGIQSGSAGAKSLYVDYVKSAQLRVIAAVT